MEEKKIEFLYKAIEDSQGTLRAVDQKLNFLILILLIPCPLLSDIYCVVRDFIGTEPHCCLYWLTIFLLTATFGSWLTVIYYVLEGLSSNENPNNHITGTQKNNLTGIFYGFECYLKNSLDEILLKIPNDKDILISELSLEHVKICYIRDTKIIMQKKAYFMFKIFMVLGTVTMLLFLINGK